MNAPRHDLSRPRPSISIRTDASLTPVALPPRLLIHQSHHKHKRAMAPPAAAASAIAAAAAAAAGAVAPPLAKQAGHRLNAGIVRALRVRVWG
jgi:hypothetical protein